MGGALGHYFHFTSTGKITNTRVRLNKNKPEILYTTFTNNKIYLVF